MGKVTTPAPPYPEGWFCIGFSREWKAGSVGTRPFAGGDAVVYRTRRGVLRVIRPYCPHLGAHLGAGGTVDGEYLVCPFHRFAFAPDGTCARTPYGTPPRASLTLLPSREAYGIVWAWHSPDGAPPSGELPSLPGPFHSPRAFRATEEAGTPEEVTERVVGRILSRAGSRHVGRRALGPGAALVVIEPVRRHLRAAPWSLALWVLATPVSPGRVRRWTAGSAAVAPVARLPRPLSQRARQNSPVLRGGRGTGSPTPSDPGS
ncbi:Rieske 2Fe-2S domain-containing protein [Streptomyces roseoverticillatus]|uniref:Rieske 2Fe-2S domain-containing protein n=1 Tax=Streptomyces roseoverticillatus TaxID=66429 RepID=UPI0033E40394